MDTDNVLVVRAVNGLGAAVQRHARVARKRKVRLDIRPCDNVLHSVLKVVGGWESGGECEWS